jgi:benzylsuccinate CoA-transferase BbsF subunit
MGASALPLAGIRVTDFTWIGAGSYATKILADYGAEVIKIESGARLDALRLSAPYKDKVKGVNRSGYFADRNTGKRSITLNMKDPRAVALARKLVAASDIVANNFTPDVMARFGLSYEDACKIRPDIIYLAMSMQGASGPESRYLGYGASMAALTGLQHLIGLPGREPIGTGTNYPDHIPNPCHAAFAVLAALRHRRRTGEGQYIDFAQTEPTVALLGPAMLDLTVNGREQQAIGNAHATAAPHGVYPCRGDDRWIAIAATTDAQWRALAGVLGKPEWTTDRRWAESGERHADRARLDAAMGEATRGWDAHELMGVLQRAQVPAGVVQNAEDVVARDPQLAHRGHWIELEHPEMGRTIYNASPFRGTALPQVPSRAAPTLGEHTDAVCRVLLGLEPGEIAELRRAGVLA